MVECIIIIWVSIAYRFVCLRHPEGGSPSEPLWLELELLAPLMDLGAWHVDTRAYIILDLDDRDQDLH